MPLPALAAAAAPLISSAGAAISSALGSAGVQGGLSAIGTGVAMKAGKALSQPVVRQITTQVASDAIGNGIHHAVTEGIPNMLWSAGDKMEGSSFKPIRGVGRSMKRGAEMWDNSDGGYALQYLARTTGGILGQAGLQSAMGSITKPYRTQQKQQQKQLNKPIIRMKRERQARRIAKYIQKSNRKQKK